MFETLVSFVMAEHLWGETFQPAAGPVGYTRLLSAERRPLRTADGYLAVLPYLDEHWRAFCEAADRKDLLEDARFRPASRLEHIDALHLALGAIMATRPTAEWLERLQAAGVPAMPLRSLADLLDDEHLQATGFWSFADHPSEGRSAAARAVVAFLRHTCGRAAPGAAPGRAHLRGPARSGTRAGRGRRADRRAGGPAVLMV